MYNVQNPGAQLILLPLGFLRSPGKQVCVPCLDVCLHGLLVLGGFSETSCACVHTPARCLFQSFAHFWLSCTLMLLVFSCETFLSGCKSPV